MELGLKSAKESFPSINLKSVADWEYSCLSQKTTHRKIPKISPSMYKSLQI